MREITVDDARRVMVRGCDRGVLSRIGIECGATALAAILVDSVRVRETAAGAIDPVREAALAVWLDGYADHVLSKPEALADFGGRTCILIGVEADGTLRLVTYSEDKADCDRLAAMDWGGRWMRTYMSHIPWVSHLGVGHGGVPQPLPYQERLALYRTLPPAYRGPWLGAWPRATA